MTINVTVLPESGGAPPLVRTAPPGISAAGVNEPSALARQQLINAVPAPALVPSYNAHATTVPKLLLPARTASTVSSPLAAQFIAQQPDMSDEELAIFVPRAALAKAMGEQEAPDDFLTAMKIARGDVALAAAPNKAEPPAATANSNAAQAAAQPAVAEATKELAIITKLKAAVADEVARRAAASPAFAASLPPVLTQATRPPSFTKVRGVQAYQIAQARNATLPKPADASAIEIN